MKNLLLILLVLISSTFVKAMDPEIAEPKAKEIKLLLSDDKEVPIALEVAITSNLIKKMLEDTGEEIESSIPLPQISCEQFELLLPALLNQVLQAKLKKEKCQEAQRELCRRRLEYIKNLSSEELVHFISAADLLDIELRLGIFSLAYSAMNSLALRIMDGGAFIWRQPQYEKHYLEKNYYMLSRYSMTSKDEWLEKISEKDPFHLTSLGIQRLRELWKLIDVMVKKCLELK